jgi:hypothetical protein
MTPASQKFTAAPLTFSVRHELWDGNIHDHADQGVSIAVMADVAGKETTLLRFNCFDQEKSYIYGPENSNLDGLPATPDGAMGQLYRMDPIADGNPIGWAVKTLQTKLPKMLERAGYPRLAAATDLAEVGQVLPQVEACARELFAAKRNTVKHNRGTDIFEAGNIRFGLEMRRQAGETAAWPFTCWRTSAGRRENRTWKKPRSWPSTASGKPRITTMARATRTIASFGTRHWSRTRSGGSSSSSRTESWEP